MCADRLDPAAHRLRSLAEGLQDGTESAKPVIKAALGALTLAAPPQAQLPGAAPAKPPSPKAHGQGSRPAPPGAADGASTLPSSLMREPGHGPDCFSLAGGAGGGHSDVCVPMLHPAGATIWAA
eukprot:scaffold707_cov145-Isochrysis_galbana.AAC.3